LDEINDQTGGVDFLDGEIIVQCGILNRKISFNHVEWSISGNMPMMKNIGQNLFIFLIASLALV